MGCGGFRSLPPIASLHWGLFIFSPSDFDGYTGLGSYIGSNLPVTHEQLELRSVEVPSRLSVTEIEKKLK